MQTLKLYSALCYQSNYRAQHAICHYCDGRQLLYSIKSEFMPGQLRMGFFDTLIALHLESYVNSVETSQNEYIVPMGAELRDLYSGTEGDTKNSMKSLRSGHQLNSILLTFQNQGSKKCVFTNTQSRFASVVVVSILGPLCPVRYT